MNTSKKSRRIPSISTASLPDIVFMLLFFFMTVTTIKNQEVLLENELPVAEHLSKLEKKDRVIEIFVGKPAESLVEKFGRESVIQLDDKIKSIDEVADYILSELSKKPSELRKHITISLKIDKNTKLGVVLDIKEELRKINTLKINYSTFEGNSLQNFN